MKLRTLFVYVAVLLIALLGSAVSAEEVVKDQARIYTTWDDTYFYLSLRVDSPDVQATHAAPNTDLTGDDSISVYIETTGKRPEKMNANCFSMMVSAAGGSQFCEGNEVGSLKPAAVWTYKYGTNVQGTINNGDDIDMGYTAEMAIPWDVLKTVKPGMGGMFSFNVVIRRHGQSADNFISLSPNVKSEQDIASPAKWTKLVFAAYGFGVVTASAEKIVSAKYTVRAPLINGLIAEREWHANTSFAVDMPMPAGMVYEAKFPAHKMTFAPYYYSWQSDKRKAATIESPVWDKNVVLANFPIKNLGPWFTYDRTEWHKEELSDLTAAGIDVVLPLYLGNTLLYKTAADKGLACLVSAIQELDAEGKPYPMVGLNLMLTPFTQAAPTKAQSWDAAYTWICQFYDRVPMKYRAIAQAGKPRNGQPGYIVYLNPESYLNAELVEYCNARFEKEYGCPLVFIMNSQSAQGFDGGVNVAPSPSRISFTSSGQLIAPLETISFNNSGRLHVASIEPGYDYSIFSAAKETHVVSRLDGETYMKNWVELYQKSPAWVVCDSWNNFQNGTQLCASREYGRKYIEATAASIKKFNGNLEYSVRYMRFNAPKVIAPKQFALAEIEIKNAGNSPWRVADGYAIGYRWYRSGRFAGESKVRRPIERDILPGETATLNVGIATVDTKGAAIADGPCEVRIELIRNSDGKWFSALGSPPLILPVTIGTPTEWSATYLSDQVPAMMAGGHPYRASIRVRNDGTQTWPKGVTKLGCKLQKVNFVGAGDDKPIDIPIKDCRATLAKDCKPGEIAEFSLDVNLTQPDKKPVTAWKQDDRWTYQLSFDLFNGEKWLTELGCAPLNRSVAVFANDFGPRIVDCDIATKLMAGQTVDVKVVARNTGVESWDKKRTKIGYHWYHLDGTEMLWDGIVTPIKQNMQPGWPTVLSAQVKAPEYDGQYVLVWDMMIDDVWQSTQPLSRGGDILPVFVEVEGGKLAFADLSKVYDLTGFSPETNRASGNFDGKGSSFPLELMPPDAGVTDAVKTVYPAGYRCDLADHPDGRISFNYPQKTADAKNVVACKGQSIAVEKTNFTALHILGASSNGTAAGDIVLNYAEGDQPASIKMSDWTTGPANGEALGYVTRHRHSATADEGGKTCQLYHYTIALDASKTLSSITLPNNPDMKMVAITLERMSIPTFLAPK